MWSFHYELDHAVSLRKKCVVFPTTYVLSWMETCTALTHDNVTSTGCLAAEELHAEAFGYGIAAVISTTACFLMRNDLTPT